MYRHNNYNIGDIVKHVESVELEFRILNILRPVKEEVGSYLYVCKKVLDPESSELYNYQGVDLLFGRIGTRLELEQILKESLKSDSLLTDRNH